MAEKLSPNLRFAVDHTKYDLRRPLPPAIGEQQMQAKANKEINCSSLSDSAILGCQFGLAQLN